MTIVRRFLGTVLLLASSACGPDLPTAPDVPADDEEGVGPVHPAALVSMEVRQGLLEGLADAVHRVVPALSPYVTRDLAGPLLDLREALRSGDDVAALGLSHRALLIVAGLEAGAPPADLADLAATRLSVEAVHSTLRLR